MNQSKLIVTLNILFAFLLIISSGCSQSKEENNPDIADKKVLPRPAWVTNTPIVFVGNWDDPPLFKRRLGGSPEWQEEEYYKDHNEENVIKLKEMGVTLAIIHFYKGFGIEAEKEQMEEAKKLSILLKKHGIKVGVYVGSTVGYETILLENPDFEEWFVPDYLGMPVRYVFDPKQTFRKMAYFMHPGYIKYMKKVLDIAINDLKVDLIHFDNTSGRAIPATFHHPMAKDNFREYLKEKYTPEILKKRFGFTDMSYVEPPAYSSPPNKIIDPLFQEWTDFRCQQLADFYGIMEKYIRESNPEVAIDNNPAGLTGNNNYWVYGADHPRLLAHTDFFWSEEGNDATVNKSGVLVSKIRSYKMASTLNNRVFTYTTLIRNMAESMAYDNQIGMVGGLSASDVLPDEQKSYIKFFHKNFEYYRDVENIADVAVLHSFSTMAFNTDRPYQSTYLIHQVLIQEKIPFDIIFDENLKDLSKYKVLILSDQECLSVENLDLIKDFVKKGGGLVATEHSSLYNEWRQRKLEFGLKDLFQVDAPVWKGNKVVESLLNIPIQKNQIGDGRVAYIPVVEPTNPKPTLLPMLYQYWTLPVNNDDIIESVKWASEDRISLNIEGPKTVTMELTQKNDKSLMILHLINYDPETPVVQNIKVDVSFPDGKKVTQVNVITPDGRDVEIIPFEKSGKGVVFTVPTLSIYDIVVMKLE